MSARIYAEIRGSYLSGSLQNLATASITTSTKKSAADEIYRQGTSGIGMYANGMEGIFLAEYQNITAIFAREEWAVVFENTCSKALMDFAQTVLELNRHIKSNMITDCFLAYEVMEIVSGVSSRLDSQTGELKSAFVDAMKPIRETAKSSIFDLIDDVRRRTQSIASLPGDAAALPYTTELMTRLQAFTPYQRSIGSILASIGDGNWKTGSVSATGSSTSLPSLKSFDVGADWNKLLAHYMLDTMETLLTTLESKARMLLKNRSVVGVFMANNVAVIDRMIRSSELSSVLSCDGAPAKIDSWGKKGTAAYLDGWRELCTILTDLNFSSRSIRPPSSSIDFHDSAAVLRGLAGKDRDMIKDKFKAFNTSFDELCSKHRTLTLEKEIRGPLITELKTIVEPAYSGFWKLFHAIDKGKAKYVKYDAGSLSAQLLRL
jgi:exocyst complex protein 7